VKRSVVTNNVGEYAFAAVEPGTYTVHVSLQGFKTVDRPASASARSNSCCGTSRSKSARSPSR
jgi:hypothetical protein